ncbi:DUF7668 domain-containing protein [Sphingomonas bacterium]|uniref:DUF7668 domain-containing protein n=1 Tax=Sphingomonas bacterium TaxID=1895847 RepID=UPI001575F7F7|nr:hypothetical protein [Sphingomonas bacterium]
MDEIDELVAQVVDAVADGGGGAVLGLVRRSRPSRADIDHRLADYGRTFVRTPADYRDVIDVVAVDGAPVPTWSVRAPLWTAQEGRSDLTAVLTVSRVDGKYLADLDDLLVL